MDVVAETPLIDARDRVLQGVVPTLMVPRFSELAPLALNGHRVLAAQDGWWLEVRRPWLHTLVQIAASPVALPYGQVRESVTFLCGRPPRELLCQMLQSARRALPLEVAYWLTWHPASGWRVRHLDPISSSSAHVQFHRPRLERDECLVLDFHSHGHYPAGFSSQDNEDDKAEVKACLVAGFGNLLEPDFKARLCLLGLFLPLNLQGWL